jgi:hypothetical protein
MITKFTTKELITELLRRDAWLDRNQAAPMLNMTVSTLRKKDSRKTHNLTRYKAGKNGRVSYKFSDVMEELKRQQVPV